MSERLFEVVKFGDGRLLKYEGAKHPQDRRLRADLFLSLEIFGEYEAGYAQIVPRIRPSWPTPQEFADETLADTLARGWASIPAEVSSLLATSRTAIVSAHGNTYIDSEGEDSDWYAHLEDDHVVEIPALVGHHLVEYETVILGICNPGRLQPRPPRGTLIYPSYMFGLSYETEMLIQTAGT